MIPFLTLQFAWAWIPISMLVVGVPLLAILMFLRMALHNGRARWAALATLVVMAAGVVTGEAFLDEIATGDVLLNLTIGFTIATAACWIWSIIEADRLRIWTDLIVLILPLGIGLLLWHLE